MKKRKIKAENKILVIVLVVALVVALFALLGSYFKNLGLASSTPDSAGQVFLSFGRLTGGPLTGAAVGGGDVSLPVEEEEPIAQPNEPVSTTESKGSGLLQVMEEATSTTCGDVTASLTLTANVSSTGTCMNMLASDVVLNCDNYKITYASDGGLTEYGVVGNGSRITIKNCRIVEGSTAGSGANYAVFLNNSRDNVILNNTVITNDSQSYGIYFVQNVNSTLIVNNTITTQQADYSVLIDSFSQANILRNNTIFSSSASLSTRAVWIGVESHYNNLSNNTIRTKETYGLLLSNSSGSEFISNTIEGRSGGGGFIPSVIDTNSPIEDNIFTDNNFTATGARVLYLLSGDGSFRRNVFRGNFLWSTGSSAYVSNSNLIARNTFTNNTVLGTGTSPNAVFNLDGMSNQVFYNNTIIGTNGNIGFYLLGNANNNTFESNSINISGNGYGIYMATSDSYPDTIMQNNTFLNNNISAGIGYEIYQLGTGSNVNYFVYNNSVGQIKWLDNGTGSFLRNLTLNVSSEHGLGLGHTIFIGDNVIGINTSAFTNPPGENPRFNSSVEIIMRGLAFDQVDRIMKVNNFSSNTVEINASGTDCLGASCTLIRYSGGVLTFNTTSLSSYAADDLPDLTPPNITNFFMNVSNASNVTRGTIQINATVNDSGTTDTVLFGFTNSVNSSQFNVTTARGGPYYFANLSLAALTDGLFTITIYANDTSRNMNNSVSNLSFRVDNSPPPVTLGMNFTNASNFSSFANFGGLNKIELSVTSNDTTTY
ncbi:right-handed parallel beta-helix repeat-containing protein, partial [Candidatus Woesearchaeota archaeon]|nr:right-handed parallel beta-helix repeat-containing protein [Candidatus Woesearchaeota archaeon]